MLANEIAWCDQGLFDEFKQFYYGEWPKQRRVGGRAAWITYRRLRSHGYTHARIMDGLRRWVAYWERRQTPSHFIPHPTRWLNEGRMDDLPPTAPRVVGPDVNHVMGLG